MNNHWLTNDHLPDLRSLEKQCLDMISAQEPLGSILDTVTQALEELLNPIRSSITLVHGQSLTTVAAPGFPDDFHQATDGLPVGEGHGSCAAAAHRTQVVCVSDTSTDPLWAHVQHLVDPFNIPACWSFPILTPDGTPLATIALYPTAPGMPDEFHRQIIDRLSLFVRLAIEQSQGQQTRRRLENRFQFLSHRLEEVFWIMDVEQDKHVFISPAFEEVWGRSTDVLTNYARAWMESVHPDDRDRVRQADALIGDQPYRLTYRIIRPDGQIRWIHDRGFTIRDDEGQARRFVGVARDITERHLAEVALRERIKELRCLYRISSLLATDRYADNRELLEAITSILPSGFRYPRHIRTRMTLRSSVDAPPPIVHLPHHIEIPIQTDRQVLGSLEVAYSEPVDTLLHARSEGDAFIPEEIEMLHSVTSQLAHTLESHQLSRQIAKTERLNALGQLTGGVAHDFNNLLTVIISNAEFLHTLPEVGEDALELAAEIRDAARTGADLTHRLLAFSRRRPFRPQSADINDLLRDLRPMLDRTLGEHIDLRYDLGNDLAPISTDTSQLETSILNLCLNARDAMDSGGTLTIATHNTTVDPNNIDGLPDGDYICLSVTDTGCGMPAEVQERAFDPFFTTKESSGGTGLGLSMVHGFTVQSGGHISLVSTPGQGTRITLLFPVRPRHDAPVKETPSSPPCEAHEGGGRTILVVEDNDRLRETLQTMLRHLGYRTLLAPDGPAALKMLTSRDDIDALITDIVMPGGMDGHELTRQALTLNPSLPVLKISGYDKRSIDDAPSLERQVTLLAKPFGRGELSQALHELMPAPTFPPSR